MGKELNKKNSKGLIDLLLVPTSMIRLAVNSKINGKINKLNGKQKLIFYGLVAGMEYSRFMAYYNVYNIMS